MVPTVYEIENSVSGESKMHNCNYLNCQRESKALSDLIS